MTIERFLELAPDPRPLEDGQKFTVFLSYRSVNRKWVIILSIFDVATGVPLARSKPLGATVLDIILTDRPLRAVVAVSDRRLMVVEALTGRILESHRFDTGALGNVSLAVNGNEIWASFGDRRAGRQRIFNWTLSTALIAEDLSNRLR